MQDADACRYSDRPLAFLARYVKRRPLAHAAIVTAVVAAVGCSVGAQYGVKVLVDTLAGGLTSHAKDAWLAFLLLAALIAADNFLWRVASWIASYTFVAVTGDLQRRLHFTKHVGMERDATLHGDADRHRFRGDGEPADGRRLAGAGGCFGSGDVPPCRRGPAAASRIRPPSGGRRRRNGGRRRQLAPGLVVLRARPRTQSA